MTNLNVIRTEIIAADQIDEHLALASLVYDTVAVTDREHFAWKHCGSPCGSSTCIALRSEDASLVGRLLMQPRRFIVAVGEEWNGATITDFVIDPKHRSAAKIIGMIKSAKAPTGISIVLHSSNAVSDPLYSQLFKFKREFWLQALGCPVRIDGLLKRYIKSDWLCGSIDILISPFRWGMGAAKAWFSFNSGIHLAPPPSAADLDSILTAFKVVAGPHFERTTDFIKWRFDESPLFPGHLEWLWKDGTCLGFVAWQQIDKRGLRVFAITDLVIRRPLSSQEAATVKLLLIGLCVAHGMDAVFALVNLGNSILSCFAGFPFFRIPPGQLPHSSPIYLHAAPECFPSIGRAKTYLTLADLDYF
jgi:hypothetical protein